MRFDIVDVIVFVILWAAFGPLYAISIMAAIFVAVNVMEWE